MSLDQQAEDAATPLQRAVKALGGQAAMSRLLGVSQPTVWAWVQKGQMPADDSMVLKVEAETGVSKHDLRPDIYPRHLAPVDIGGAMDAAR